MEISEFRKKQAHYLQKTRERQPERLNYSDDTPFFIAVLEEMLIDLIQRVEKVEELLKPAPDEEIWKELGRKSEAQ